MVVQYEVVLVVLVALVACALCRSADGQTVWRLKKVVLSVAVVVPFADVCHKMGVAKWATKCVQQFAANLQSN